MANELRVGARVNFFVNGIPLEWFTKAQVTAAPNKTEIRTVNEGYAGESPGTPMVEISVDFAVPASAENLALLWNNIADGSFLPAQFNCGAFKYASTGTVTNLQVSGGVDEVTSGSFSWRGELKKARL